MRIALAFLVLLGLASTVQADSGARAMAVADALAVDTQTADRLIDIVARYDIELARLERQRIEVKRRLLLARHDNPKDIDFLLEDAIANQRAVAQNEEQLIRRARKVLGAKRAAELLVLLNATEPPRATETAPSPIAATPESQRRSAYDPNALFPPKGGCDPFESMHGCGR
jgi:hypothetical protein